MLKAKIVPIDQELYEIGGRWKI